MSLLSINLLSQGSLKGNIKDSKTQEYLIGATVIINPTTATISDINGNIKKYRFMNKPCSCQNAKINFAK